MNIKSELTDNGICVPGSSISLRNALQRRISGYYYPPPPIRVTQSLLSLRPPLFSSWARSAIHDEKGVHGDLQGVAVIGNGIYLSYAGQENKAEPLIIKTDSSYYNYHGKTYPHNCPRQFNHYGAICHSGGKILTPAERDNYEHAAAILVFDPVEDLSNSGAEIRYTPDQSGVLWSKDASGMLIERKHSGWCAINNLDGFLYTSDETDVAVQWSGDDKLLYINKLAIYNINRRDPAIAEIYTMLLPYYKNGDTMDSLMLRAANLPFIRERVDSCGIENAEMLMDVLRYGLLPYEFVGYMPLTARRTQAATIWDAYHSRKHSVLDTPYDFFISYGLKKSGIFRDPSGGYISSMGRIYLSYDCPVWQDRRGSILAFTALSGVMLGGIFNIANNFEIEGIYVREQGCPSSVGGRVLLATQCDYYSVEPRRASVDYYATPDDVLL